VCSSDLVNEKVSQEQLNSPIANESLEPDEFTYGGNAPAPRPTKLMPPDELEQWKEQERFKAGLNPPSAGASQPAWSDTGRVDKDGNAIMQRTTRDGRLETMTAPFGAKVSPGAEAADAKKRQAILDSTNDTLNAIDELLDENGNLRPEVRPAIGTSRLMFAQLIPGTDAYNAQASIDRVRARMVTNLMGELKSQSRTGATGFGQLNLQELKIIQDAAAKLDPGQGEAAMQTELQNIRRRLQKVFDDGTGSVPGGGGGGGGIQIISIEEVKK
jgi:hypothetical protein